MMIPKQVRAAGGQTSSGHAERPRSGRPAAESPRGYFCQSMEHLQADRLSESEAAMLNAQRRSLLPLDLANSSESNEPPTVQQLRQALDKLAMD
jgi:hypothetical protein